RIVDQRRLRAEQAELEAGLVRVRDGQPAIGAAARGGVERESELVDVEAQRLVLVVNVDSGDLNLGAHGTSDCCSASPLSPASRRRFSETAIVRSGRCAALT